MTYEPGKYWTDRLASHFTKKGVGHLAFSERYNDLLYRLKRLAFGRAVRSHRLDIGNSSVLDIGCGTGFFAELFRERGVARYTGMDITPVSVENLSRQYAASLNFSFRQGDITQGIEGLGLEVYDVVNIWDVIYHVVSDNLFQAAMKNMAALLNKNGVLMMTDMFSTTCQPAGHVKFRSLELYRPVLSECGLVVEKIVPLYYLMNRDRPDSIRRIAHAMPGLLYGCDRLIRLTGLPNGANLKLAVMRKR